MSESSLKQLAMALAVAVVASPPAGMAQERGTIQGAWELNRELTPAPPGTDGETRRPEGRRPPGGGGGAPGGGGGFGGFGGGMPGGRQGPSEEQMRKFDAVRRRIQEAPERLVISLDGNRVQLVDELGRTTNLVADGKKQDRLTGDGRFKSTARLDGGRLVVEEDFDGPKVTTTFERVTSDGASRLQVSLQVDGMPEGRGGRGGQNGKPAPITRIYDASKPAP